MFSAYKNTSETTVTCNKNEPRRPVKLIKFFLFDSKTNPFQGGARNFFWKWKFDIKSMKTNIFPSKHDIFL